MTNNSKSFQQLVNIFLEQQNIVQYSILLYISKPISNQYPQQDVCRNYF